MNTAGNGGPRFNLKGVLLEIPLVNIESLTVASGRDGSTTHVLFNIDIKTQHAVHYLIEDLIREKMNEVLLLNNVPRRNTLQHVNKM